MPNQWNNGIAEYQTAHGPRFKIRVKHWDFKASAWRTKETHGFLTKRKAEYARDKLRNTRFEERQFPDRVRHALTIEALVNAWLKDYAQTHCKPSTFQSYNTSFLKYIIPALGPVRVVDLAPSAILQLFLSLQSQGLAKQTIKNIFIPFKEAYSHHAARHPDIIQHHPMIALKPFFKTVRDARRHVHPLTKEQIRCLLRAAQDAGALPYTLLLCAVRTGLRRGELLGLEWPAVNLLHGKAHIRRAIVRGKETTPKNHQARTVDLSPQLVDALQRFPVCPRSAAVFHHHNRPISAAYVNVMFNRVALAAGLPAMRFHDLRHTYASHLIDLGANPKYIQAQLGHSTINVTFDIYGHLLKAEQNDIIARLDSLGGL